MYTLPRTSTTQMEVTSIRLERELKERLKEFILVIKVIKALIRDILWDYVQQKSNVYYGVVAKEDIRACVPATAQKEERCAITGHLIPPEKEMLLGLTKTGDMIPLSVNSLG